MRKLTEYETIVALGGFIIRNADFLPEGSLDQWNWCDDHLWCETPEASFVFRGYMLDGEERYVFTLHIETGSPSDHILLAFGEKDAPKASPRAARAASFLRSEEDDEASDRSCDCERAGQ